MFFQWREVNFRTIFVGYVSQTYLEFLGALISCGSEWYSALGKGFFMPVNNGKYSQISEAPIAIMYHSHIKGSGGAVICDSYPNILRTQILAELASSTSRHFVIHNSM